MILVFSNSLHNGEMYYFIIMFYMFLNINLIMYIYCSVRIVTAWYYIHLIHVTTRQYSSHPTILCKPWTCNQGAMPVWYKIKYSKVIKYSMYRRSHDSYLSIIITLVIIHHWSYTIGECINWSCVSMCVSIWTHISVTAGRNVLILGMLMGYDVGLVLVVSNLWYCLVS